MSRIDKLIADLCPDGVSHYQLGEIAGYSDTRMQASQLDKTTFVGVDNLLPNKGGRVDANHAPNTSSLTAYETGDLLLGNIRPYLKKIWLSDRIGGCSGDVLAVRLSKEFHPLVNARFLYYTLSSDRFFSYATQHSKGAKMPRGDKAAILNFRVPVPPLEVQREIVRVLDKFTQLEAELEARRRQYGMARRTLLGKCKKSPILSLGKACAIKAGNLISKSVIEKSPGPYPVINSGREPLGFTSLYNTEDNPLGITSRGAGVGSVTWCLGRYFRGSLNYSVTIREPRILDTRFLFHALNEYQKEIKSLCTFEGIPALNKKNLEKLEIPAPRGLVRIDGCNS